MIVQRMNKFPSRNLGMLASREGSLGYFLLRYQFKCFAMLIHSCAFFTPQGLKIKIFFVNTVRLSFSLDVGESHDYFAKKNRQTTLMATTRTSSPTKSAASNRATTFLGNIAILIHCLLGLEQQRT